MSYARRALGKRVRHERTAAGLTQSELAEKAGTSRKTLSSVERGDSRVSHDSVMVICHALGMDTDGMSDNHDSDPTDDQLRDLVEVFRDSPREVRRVMLAVGAQLTSMDEREREATIDALLSVVYLRHKM